LTASRNVLPTSAQVPNEPKTFATGRIDMTDENASSRGEEPSIVQSFRIEGLYGYRTISLSSDYAATILIAKNGSGKTTLLAALDAFLKKQFSRLRDIKFSRICCKLRGFEEELVITPSDVQQYPLRTLSM
jgi:hypothetical protein